MARRIKKLVIEAEGRDKGKTFVLTEMPADQAEWWGTRALLALTNAGAELPAGAETSGMAGFAAAGVTALAQLKAETVKPLLDEMFGCVQYEHNPQHPLQPILAGEASQIEEVATRIKIREALFELHLGFSLRGAGSTSASARSPDPLPPA